MRKMLFLAGLTVLITGCESFVTQGYVSPRVTGRVLDAATRAPLRNASVRRWADSANPGSYSYMPPRGGEMLMTPGAALTDHTGHFKLAAEQVALGVVSIISMEFEFRCSGYQTLVTNFPSSLITNTASKGPPTIIAGDILLERAKP
jgi:protocatechuate 3,4-dioxygenase beta subunit